jgi:transposase-like protein
MTKKKQYRRYSPEFKRHALKRASADGVTDIEVCEDLGISPRQLRRWRDQYRLLGDEAFPGQSFFVCPIDRDSSHRFAIFASTG